MRVEAGTVARAEHLLFHRAPADALAALRGVDGAHARWLYGVALGALGRYGTALEVLTAGDLAEPRFASLAASTAASIYRQLGRHTDAEELDLRALAVLRQADGAADAVFDARLGLAADAVGLHRGTDARRLLRDAAAALPADSWRARVRFDWVATEVALLDGDPAGAVDTARRAVSQSEAAQAPRHVAKSLLFLGASLIAELQATGGRADEAAAVLRRAVALADGVEARPLLWVARALLGALVAPTDPDGSAENLRAARTVVLAIADDLPPADRAAWLSRPDLAALGISS